MEAPESYYPPEKVEHFIVEDLLDFSNEAAGFPEGDGETFGTKAGHSTATSTVVVTSMDNCNSSSSYNSNFCLSFADTTLNDDFCVPYELKELEWLSNLEEEPFSTEDLQKLQLISGLKPSSPSSIAAGRSAQQTHLFLPENPVPGKARSKRSRAAPRNWSSRLPILSPTAASSLESVELTTRVAASEGRKCLHCAAEKTPQWRTGPMGPKTLCNACGVRYKSGRLVPEYRPAASPTFLVSEHSNSHRKVLELRHQKERQQQFLGPGEVYNGGTEDDFLIRHHVGPYDGNLF